jgi:hypothetical protein
VMVQTCSRCGDLFRVERARRAGQAPKTWTREGLERLRAAALVTRPWELTCGPKTTDGKARSARNGRWRQKGEKSIRELRAELADVFGFIAAMTASRRLLPQRVHRDPDGLNLTPSEPAAGRSL